MADRTTAFLLGNQTSVVYPEPHRVRFVRGEVNTGVVHRAPWVRFVRPRRAPGWCTAHRSHGMTEKLGPSAAHLTQDPIGFVLLGSDRGGRTAAVLYSSTGTCRRHDIDPARLPPGRPPSPAVSSPRA